MNVQERTLGNGTSAPASVRVRVQILADALLYEGFVEMATDRRIEQELNDPRPFLNLTEATIQDRGTASAVHTEYVALNKGAITHVVLLTAEAAARDSEPSAEALAAAAARPMVPAAGPRTIPGPPPMPRGGRLKDPPTQPFPRRVADEAVSDLILDDDGGDDIDPDDLERDVGALIAGAAGAD